MEIINHATTTAIAVAVLAVVALIGLGSLATELGPWYYELKQPRWKPSDLWFGPVWLMIFTLLAIAGLRAWAVAPEGGARFFLAAVLIANGLLNVAWSFLFFKWRRPDWALLEVVPFWLSIGFLMLVCARHDSWAPWLLLPYLLWVAFAAALNRAVVRLNGPFGGR
jgi:translocator protein